MRLQNRHLVPEQMDAPDLDPVLHRQALAGLRRLNWICGASDTIARRLLRMAEARGLNCIRILDLGCGSGDVAIDVAQRVGAKMECRMTGWDMSPVAIETAREQWAATQSKSPRSVNVHFEVADVFANPVSSEADAPAFDFVVCSLFLHHFTDDQAVELLGRMKRWALHGVLVDDLIRSHWGWFLATTGCHLFTRSPIVHFDGPQSVRAAFTRQEMTAMATAAQLVPCTVHKHWPERFLFAWERSR